MKAILFTRWNLMRVLRAAMGIAAILFAVRDHDYMLGAAGGLLIIMGVVNVGCCGVGACSVRSRPVAEKNAKNKQEEIRFEEVV